MSGIKISPMVKRLKSSTAVKNRHGEKLESSEPVRVDKKQADENYLVLCAYAGGEERPIHPEVCKWHLEEKDPNCAGCDPDKKPKQKEVEDYY